MPTRIHCDSLWMSSTCMSTKCIRIHHWIICIKQVYTIWINLIQLEKWPYMINHDHECGLAWISNNYLVLNMRTWKKNNEHTSTSQQYMSWPQVLPWISDSSPLGPSIFALKNIRKHKETQGNTMKHQLRSSFRCWSATRKLQPQRAKKRSTYLLQIGSAVSWSNGSKRAIISRPACTIMHQHVPKTHRTGAQDMLQ